MKLRIIVIAVKLLIICFAVILSFSLVYYAPRIPPILKPLVPPAVRWTEKEIVEQIKTNRVDKDYLAYFSRDPERFIPQEKNILVAPADGTVKAIKNRWSIKDCHLFELVGYSCTEGSS